MANDILVGPNDKFVEQKYTITEFFMMIDGKPYEFPVERVRNFKIENYYSDALFPIFKVVVSMESSRYYLMIQNKEKVKFKLRIQTYTHPVGEISKKSMLKDFINDTFVFFPEESGDDFDKEIKKDAEKPDNTNVLEETTNDIELFLFKDGLVNGLRSQTNYILKDINLATAVLFLLKTAGVKDIIMSPMDNTTKYDYLVLPPLSIDRQIRYLDTNFGFYKEGMIFFMGLQNSYVINYNGKCNAYANNEIQDTVIYVMEASNTQSKLSANIKKVGEKRNYINLLGTNLQINNKSVTDNVLSGIDATVIDTSSNTKKSVIVSDNALTLGKTNSKTIFNELDNPYLDTMYKSQQSSNSAIITFAIENADISAFEPNKSISMVFESTSLNKKYKGNYIVTSAIHIFNGTSEMFNCTSMITLRKE